MLVFPSLGSQAEAAQNRPRDSGCPWNNTLYPESQRRSIHFSQLYLTLLRVQVPFLIPVQPVSLSTAL
jgi:hypothetical protein